MTAGSTLLPVVPEGTDEADATEFVGHVVLEIEHGRYTVHQAQEFALRILATCAEADWNAALATRAIQGGLDPQQLILDVVRIKHEQQQTRARKRQ